MASDGRLSIGQRVDREIGDRFYRAIRGHPVRNPHEPLALQLKVERKHLLNHRYKKGSWTERQAFRQ